MRAPHLAPASASASAAAPPYFFRWQRGAKQVKTTKPRPLDPTAHAYEGRLALYVTVRRAGPSFVPDDPADPLDSTLQLLLSADAPPVAETRFDIPAFLHTLVQAGKKSMNAVLTLSPAVDVGFTLTINTIGGGSLAPYTDPHRPSPVLVAGAPTAAARAAIVDPGEAAAALELERLRADVREKEGRIDALASSTDKLDHAVQQHAKLAQNTVPAGDVAALQVRITALEEQKNLVEREKAEAERKVAAHVAHAAKIKATYNQLAAWYNNLRKEHADLQEKHPASAAEQSTARELPQDVSTTHEADYKSLERERDELQVLLHRERSEKKDMYSRNSELLQTKARTLAELREQWDASQITLSSTQKTKDEQAKLLTGLQKTVKELQAQLSAKEGNLSERSLALTEATNAMKEAEAKHDEAIKLAVSAAVAEAKASASVQIEHLKQQHEEASMRQKEEANTAREAALREELSKIRAEHETELERVKKSVEELQATNYSEKLEVIRKEHEQAIGAKEELTRKGVSDAENAVKALEDKIAATANENVELQKQVAELTKQRAALDVEKGDALSSVQEAHNMELTKVQGARENAEAELAKLRKALVIEKEAISEYKEKEQHRATLEEELASARAQVATLQKANTEMQSSPRDVAATQSTTEESNTILEEQVSELRVLLKAETDKRHQTVNLLVAADSEHDELRAMVSRLRSERDEAVQDLKRARDVPNPEVGIGAVPRNAANGNNQIESDNLLEERDKAIRELFRVRKGLNKEVKRLKKEKEELSQLLNNSNGGQASSTNRSRDNDGDAMMSDLRAQRDHAMSELQKVQNYMNSSNDGSSVQRSLTAVEKPDEISSAVLAKLDKLRGELTTYQTANRRLEESLSEKETKIAQLSTGTASSSSSVENSGISYARKEVTDGKAAIEVLKTEIDQLTQSAKSREQALEDEVARLETTLEQQVTSSRDLSQRLQQNEASLIEDQARLQSERLEKDKESTKFEALMQKLKSRNASLTVKLAGEKNQREEAQSRLVAAETNLQNLENELSELQESGRNTVDATKKLMAEKEQALMSLTETRKRLEMAESRLAERQIELSEARDRLRNVESSREFLQKEASEAGGKNQAVTEEVTVLRADLKQTQGELHKALRDLELEVEKGSHRTERENAFIADLEGRKEALSTERNALQSKYERTADELRVLKESYDTLQSVLQRVQEKSRNLGKSVSEKSEECVRLQAMVSKMKATNEQLTARSESLRGEHQLAKQEQSRVQQEINVLKGEKSAVSEKMRSLEQELSDMQDRFSLMQEENEDMLSAERSNAEREARKAAEMRKELRSARSVAETLQAEMEELQASYAELTNEKASLKETGEDREGELTTDLINTRVELAYAKDEAIRLRNKLKKVAQGGQGSASFEH